jgi:hypothetical protein
MSILADYLFVVQEGKSTTRKLVTRTRKQKIDKAMHQLAINYARKKNDPAYKQMVKYKKKYKEFQAALHKRFASKVRSQARE